MCMSFNLKKESLLCVLKREEKKECKMILQRKVAIVGMTTENLVGVH